MDALYQYLADHHGVLTRAQAFDLGLTPGQLAYRVRTGAFVRVGPGVFRHASSPDTWEAWVRAGALAARGLVTGRSALRIWGVDGYDRHRGGLVVANHDRRRVGVDGIQLRRTTHMDDMDGRLVGGIPVAGVVQAVLEAARQAADRELDTIVDAVVRQRSATLDDLAAALERGGTQGRAGLGRLRRLVELRDPTNRVPDSRFNRMVGRLLVDGGLAEPVYEYRVEHEGQFVARVDLAYPRRKIAIECDSARWHQDRQSFLNDRRRQNRLVLAGYTVLSFTWDDLVTRPELVVATVAGALGSRGWEDPVRL